MVKIEYAKREDFSFYYSTKCEKDNIYWSGYDNEPDLEHMKQIFNQWIEEMSELNARKVLIIYYNGVKAGYLYLSPLDNGDIEISIGVSEKFSGHGIGAKACVEAIKFMKNEGKHSLIAYIREDNHRSIHVFEKSGFVEDKNNAVCKCVENTTKELKMLKFKYILC